jgi:hypothetical protein
MPRSADQGGERDQGAVYPSIGQGDVSLAAAFPARYLLSKSSPARCLPVLVG